MSHGTHLSRRELLRRAALAAAAAACPLPLSTAWAARRPRGATLRMAFFTDVHARTEWDTPMAMEMAARAINRQKPDLVLAGGDLITDGFQSAASTVEPRWRAVQLMCEAIEAPFAPALGNHDLVAAIPEDGSEPAADPRARFREVFGLDRTYRAFDASGVHVVLLDSVAITGGNLKYEGRIDAGQLAWLEEDLAATRPGTPVVVVTHLPLLTGFYQATEGGTAAAPANRIVVNTLEVLELMQRHNVVAVLQGHLHVDEMLRWHDTRFITGGAVCGKWWRGPWHGTPEGFGVLTLRPDRVEWEYLTYGWEARRP